jgi:hypothetical protein
MYTIFSEILTHTANEPVQQRLDRTLLYIFSRFSDSNTI